MFWAKCNCSKLYVDLDKLKYVLVKYRPVWAWLWEAAVSSWAPKALCARRSSAVVIYWAAKSHKMSLTTLFHSYQSVSYFSLNPTVTCLSFPILGGVKVPFGLKTLSNLFSSAQLISSRPGSKLVLADKTYNAADVDSPIAPEFPGRAVWETISELLLRRQKHRLWTTTLFYYICDC